MNDEFENSIRKKLNEADIPFDQDAWTKMESLLDAGDKDKRPAIWWWLFLLPLLGGIGWWIMQSSSTDKKAADTVVVQKTNEKAANDNVGNDSSTTVLNTSTDAGRQDNETVKKTDHQQPAAEPSPENKPNTSTDQQLLQTDISPENKSNSKTAQHLPQTNISPENKLNNKPDNHLPENNITTTGNSTANIITGTGTKTTSAANSFVITSDSISTIKYNDLHFIKTKNINNYNGYTKINHPSEMPVNTEIQQDQHPKIPRRKINSKGLYIGVTLGPDLNVAPSLNYGKVGFNLGILGHYYFNQHWFVTTGAIYSKKLYGASSTDYKVPGNPYDLVKVNANCDVLDVPVNINYTFLQVNNNTLSATLGISNYFMLKEKYQYIYKTSPDWEKTVENQNQHYLAILNVGALYQHPAGKRLIIGVQPYAKIPLRGVGLGQVKLYSAGVSFQLNLVGKKR